MPPERPLDEINIGSMLCVGVVAAGVALLIGTLIGAVLLRFAVWVYNKLFAGTDAQRRVTEPSYERAMGVVCLAFLLDLLAGIPVRYAIGFLVSTLIGPASRLAHMVWVQAIYLPLGTVLMAGVCTYLLRTSFGRALGVAVCYGLIILVLFAVIGGGLYGLFRSAGVIDW